MGGAASRRKGHAFERFVANALKLIFPDARRQLEYHTSDCKGIDIQNTGRYRFQCKKLKKYASINMINEIKLDPLSATVPVLVTAGDGLEPMAVLPFGELIRLLNAEKSTELGGCPSAAF